MRPGLIHPRYQQSNTIRPLPKHLRASLCAVTDLTHYPLDGDGAAVGHFASKSLAFHEVREDAGVGGKAGEGEAKVLVDTDDFFLVGGEFFCVSLVAVC